MKLAEESTYTRMVSDIEEAATKGNMPLLERTLLRCRGASDMPYIFSDFRIQSIIPRVRAAYFAYEMQEALRLREAVLQEPAPRIAGSAPIVRVYRYAPFEAQAAGITNSSRYCHVGSGPFPETGLAVRAFAPAASVSCVDTDYQMMCYAREVVSALWPVGSGVTFLSAWGHEISYVGFTHVHVSARVRPERSTVQAICETADHGVTIMLRTAEGLESLLYEPISDETLAMLHEHGFRRIATVRGRAFTQTLIFRR